jgi:hypothetical protein
VSQFDYLVPEGRHISENDSLSPAGGASLIEFAIIVAPPAIVMILFLKYAVPPGLVQGMI